MKRLSREKRQEIEKFLTKGFRLKKNGYIDLAINKREGKKIKRRTMKRSRAYYQLIYGLDLEVWEIIHHMDGNKENDDIRNLEMIDVKNFNYHTSKHLIGTRGRKNKIKNK